MGNKRFHLAEETTTGPQLKSLLKSFTGCKFTPMRNAHFLTINSWSSVLHIALHCRNTDTLQIHEPRAHCIQNEDPTSRLTSHRLKTLCFLTETLTERITPDSRQVHHLETLNAECTGANRQISVSRVFCRSCARSSCSRLLDCTWENSCGA